MYLLLCFPPLVERRRGRKKPTVVHRHTFKLLPSIGKHVVELLEGTLAEELAHAWRWRPGTGDALTSRRGAPAKDLADMPGWQHDEDDAAPRARL